ncbi:DNA-3-methyladenine glycosylase I [Amniculibacterium aquaticum]|jgi:DNA-3-methyladenine glycosylase I|uniref:DNA-3-methyladenine glycosylase I n=1 Tax=Amniculibacterium aquaticum TaxID=2479858 RepID=UPI000F5A3C2F|nr:DNA-3-methyladenine glycosylase I [Amniculibacterium aquaticum]
MAERFRCPWCEKDDLYRRYHDEEWGNPVFDDKIFFEFMILEAFQAGLNWHTILKKRDGFRNAFDGFDVVKVSRYNEDRVEELMSNSDVIRNRLKILAAINNAKRFIEIQEEYGSFSNFIWSFVEGEPVVNFPKSSSDVPATTELSDTIAGFLKKRGFKFMGSTVVYAFLQATGLVNDHLKTCWRSH